MGDVREARQALTDAINRRDLAAVRSLVHSSYEATSKQGTTLGYEALMRSAEELFQIEHFEETDEVECTEVEGDTAKIAVVCGIWRR